MATNNNQANSAAQLNAFSDRVDKTLSSIENLSVMEIIRLVKGRPGIQQGSLVDQMVTKINQPILKSFAKDMLNVMVHWMEDPQVLCCIIQGLWSAYLANHRVDHTWLYQFAKRNRVLADTDFGKFLDQMIAFIDLIIIFMTQDIRRFVFIIPDFIKEIMDTLVGAILLIVQETLFALRDSAIRAIFDWIDSWDGQDQVWAKCLPLKQMINIIKKYINDYGLLSELMERIRAWVSAKGFKLNLVSKNLVPTAKDLEFLYWLRDLLIRLKRATLNFDLCVDYELTPENVSNLTPPLGRRPAVTIDGARKENMNNYGDPKEQEGITIASDGTILVDRDKVPNSNAILLPKLSNSWLREFIHNEYGLPYDVIDNTITRGSAADNIQGSVVTSNLNALTDRCANTPSAEENLRWILDLQSRF